MIKDLMMYGVSLHMLYNQVYNAIQDTVHTTIQKFIDNPMHMLDIMLEQKAIILGSIALHIMFSMNIIKEAEYAYGWYPGDMDLYVPNHEQHNNMAPLITYLIKYEGYQLNIPYTPKTYLLYGEIKDIIPLIKGSS